MDRDLRFLVHVSDAAAGGPTVDVVALLDALVAAGLSDVIQDAVAAAVGDAPDVPLGSLRNLLTGAGVGAAAALRIVRQLVSKKVDSCSCTHCRTRV
jgi:hypothetical protein